MAGNRGRHARRRKSHALLIFASTVLVLATVAIAALAARGGYAPDTRLPSPTLALVTAPGATAEATWTPPTPMTTALAPTATQPQTSAPTQTPETTPEGAMQTADPDVLALTGDNYLPILKKAQTDEKVIAITVDDLYQTKNTQAIIALALKYDGKLTLFPIGSNAVRKEMSKTLRYAHEKGMEIENHTYDHKGLYELDDTEMAKQMYLQALAVDYALGVDYQEHFFRPYGGDGLDDQRTHLYANQMGMIGIAYWTVSGSDTDADKLAGTLAPGNIYLFHSTDADTKKLKSFIPAAVKAGYRLVTLNELFGYQENTVKELDKPIRDHEIPAIAKYKLAPRTYRKGDFMWAVNLLQQKLKELGYLSGSPDGVYGDGTVKAVSKFQETEGLPVTGTADLETQKLLFPDGL